MIAVDLRLEEKFIVLIYEISKGNAMPIIGLFDDLYRIVWTFLQMILRHRLTIALKRYLLLLHMLHRERYQLIKNKTMSNQFNY